MKCMCGEDTYACTCGEDTYAAAVGRGCARHRHNIDIEMSGSSASGGRPKRPSDRGMCLEQLNLQRTDCMGEEGKCRGLGDWYMRPHVQQRATSPQLAHEAHGVAAWRRTNTVYTTPTVGRGKCRGLGDWCTRPHVQQRATSPQPAAWRQPIHFYNLYIQHMHHYVRKER